MCHKVPHRIDVLCDDGLEQPGLVQAGQGPVTLVCFSVPHLRVAFDLPPPVLPAGGRVGQELRQLNRAHLLPDALWAPEVRDAALRADSGTAEGYQVAAGTDQGGELFDCVLQFRRQHCLHYPRFTERCQISISAEGRDRTA